MFSLRFHRPGRRRQAPGLSGVAVVVGIAAAAVAQPVRAQVVIHEVLYDGLGGDADDAFTELVGPPGTSLDDWSLVGINGGTGTSYRVIDLSGTTIPSDSVFVVATSSANDSLAAVRDLIGSVDWQNGPDAVQLIDAMGSIVDALQYGDATPFNAGEGFPAPRTAAGESLSRDDAGTDSDDNLADFTRQPVPSPGVGVDLSDHGEPETRIRVSLPDTIAFGAETLTLPVRFTDTTDQGIVAVELFLTFDGSLLTPLGVLPADLIAARRWYLSANVLESSATTIDTLRIALATDTDTLAGAGTLVHARFLLADLRRPAATDLTIRHLALNNGVPPVEWDDGAVRLVGVDATMHTLPVPVVMHDSLHIRVVDSDANRDESAVDTLAVILHEGPENSPTEQIEPLFAVETDTASGIFTNSVAIVYADPVSANGIVETAPRRVLELCFDDSLDAVGATTRRCTLLGVPAHDGHLSATVVAEPGDTLWMRLADTDLNRRPGAVDTAFVAIVGQSAADTLNVSLVETGLSNAAFYGHYATSTAIGGDALQSLYLDTTPTVGDAVLVADTTHILGHFGDADGNGQLQAFDASRILTHVLAPELSLRDSLAANVDSLAPFGVITPFDAALVLQHRVGLRRRFPVQESVAVNHPRPGSATDTAATKLVARRQRRLELRHTAGYLSVWLDDRADIIAGDLLLKWEETVAPHLEPADDLRGFLLASHLSAPLDEAQSYVRIVLAGVSPASGPGEVLRLYPRRGIDFGRGSVQLVNARFNDGRIPIQMVDLAAPASSRPSDLALHFNHPNPFNTSTVISFELAEPGFMRLDVIDLLGQRVRRLVAAERRAGSHHLNWDGLDDDGQPAATGMYLSRLRAGNRELTRRMLLLR
jgi:hypothetical protein